MTRPPDATSVLLPGPWNHRSISANGVGLHMAEAGTGPLVLLLHGFPQFWWAWRHQLTAVADAGFHVVAPDLRGYGASDKPPRGYDPPTLSAETSPRWSGPGRAGRRRRRARLGRPARLDDRGAAPAQRAPTGRAVDGPPAAASGRHDRSAPAPGVGLRVALPGAAPARAHAHPRGRRPGRRPPAAVGRPDCVRTADFAEAVDRYRSAARIPQAAYSAMEYPPLGSPIPLRPDGLRYARRMSAPITAPTLQLHGELDACVLPRTARGSAGTSPAPTSGASCRHRPLPQRRPPTPSAGDVGWAQD